MIFVICVKLVGFVEYGLDLIFLEVYRVFLLFGIFQLVIKFFFFSFKGLICVQIWGFLIVFFRVWYFWVLKIYFNYVYKYVDMYGIVNTSAVTMKIEREGQNIW